jgi:hypothetical protein
MPSDHLAPGARKAHDDAVAAGRPGYLDPQTGLFVMTSAYLTDRGYCCGNGCRHCPWPPGTPVRKAR